MSATLSILTDAACISFVVKDLHNDWREHQFLEGGSRNEKKIRILKTKQRNVIGTSMEVETMETFLWRKETI